MHTHTGAILQHSVSGRLFWDLVRGKRKSCSVGKGTQILHGASRCPAEGITPLSPHNKLVTLVLLSLSTFYGRGK